MDEKAGNDKLAPSAGLKLTSSSRLLSTIHRGFKVGSRPAMPAPSGSWGDRQILGPCRKPAEAETPGFRPALCVSGTPPGDLKFANV